MTYIEYNENTNRLLDEIMNIRKQQNIICCCGPWRVRNCHGEEEHRAEYGINEVWSSINYMEQRILFFMEHYLTGMLKALKSIYDTGICEQGCSICSNSLFDEATFYFDAMVTSFETIIEKEVKEWVTGYASERAKVCLPGYKDAFYWRIKVLRNRVIHPAKARYDGNLNENNRYEDFSSKIRMINIDETERLSCKTTLIDMFSNEPYIKSLMQQAIKGKIRGDIFDIMFPYKEQSDSESVDYLMHISNNIFYDHIESSNSLLTEMLLLLSEINSMFIEKYIYEGVDFKEKEFAVFGADGEEIVYKVSDVF